MNNENNNATQVDPGWRKDTARNSGGGATQVDPGWRNDTKQGAGATQVDPGWRNDTKQGAGATQVDPGWRNDTKQGAGATQVDPGWRNDVKQGEQATLAEGFEGKPDIVSVMSRADAKYFATIEEFKTAVAQLTELTDSNGRIYPVKKTLSTSGGEAMILMCASPEGVDVVAKIYFKAVNSDGSSIEARSRVLDYMNSEEGKMYTLAVSEIGLVEFGGSNYYFEIMPYCPDGDISDDGAFSFDEIVTVTKQLNEALHSMHKYGIKHRDIKPQNLYKTETGIKLGDFGIAKFTDEGHSNVTEHILGTDGYAAPETRRYLYSEKSDYYSLGVTLATLFEGHFIFDNMNFEMQALAQEGEKLPLTKQDPNREQLENLLNGLCRVDSKQRFGYNEVNKWLKDHNYTGGGAEEEWPKAFRMLNESYRDEQSMFEGITQDNRYWEEAKTMLYSKFFEQFFMSFRTDLARRAQDIEDTYRSANTDKGLAVFLKHLFAPGPIVWKGYTFNSLSELAGKMVATKNPVSYSDMLKNKCISHWLSNTEGIDVTAETIKLVEEIEALSVIEPELACRWFGYSFAEEKVLNICNRQVSTIAELMDALFAVPKDFYMADGYEKLTNRINGADLYGFLFSFGYREAVDAEWANLADCDTFNMVCVLISMMDNIALKAEVDPTVIRSFFVNYGPMGIGTYTKNLVMRNEDKVYMPLDADGKQALAAITNFKTPEGGTVNELFKTYNPLIDAVDKLYRNLVENPHCILTGVYESKGVICNNLMGCFAFKIFDRLAPLGFNAFIESADGGNK